jgi:putative tricarboxylic transport membrane protein
MNDTTSQGLVSRKAAELCFAALLFLFGIIMITGARELETGWSSSGPEAGYFPLRIGSLIVMASVAIFVLQLLKADDGLVLIKNRLAATNILRFALPLVALVALMPKLGIYLATILYLIVAVGIIARQRWQRTLAITLLTPLAIFILFELAFRTPLPKGPLGPLLGIL